MEDRANLVFADQARKQRMIHQVALDMGSFSFVFLRERFQVQRDD
ncbi:MAG: hypothetical protein M5U05_01640 [Anaerolineales bacterium]|nr:hypothetical protein [Anaerolineales bacterium]